MTVCDKGAILLVISAPSGDCSLPLLLCSSYQRSGYAAEERKALSWLWAPCISLSRPVVFIIAVLLVCLTFIKLLGLWNELRITPNISVGMNENISDTLLFALKTTSPLPSAVSPRRGGHLVIFCALYTHCKCESIQISAVGTESGLISQWLTR